MHTCEQWQSAEPADSAGSSDLSLKMFSVLVMRADFKDTALCLLSDWSLDDKVFPVFPWPKPQEQVTHQSYQWIDRDLSGSINVPWCRVQLFLLLLAVLWSDINSLAFVGESLSAAGKWNLSRWIPAWKQCHEHMNFHIHLSGRAVSLATRWPHCRLQAATVPLTPLAGNSTHGRGGVV